MINKQRLDFIDYAKGVAILLLLLSHSAPGETINAIITSFHMPIFFIVCGVLTAYRYGEAVESGDIKRSICRRIRQLIVPYLVFGSMHVVFFASIAYMSCHEFIWQPRLYRFLTFQGVDSLWFIPVYFYAEMMLLLTLCCRNRKLTIACGLLSLVGTIVYFCCQKAPENDFACLVFKCIIAYSFAVIGWYAQCSKRVFGALGITPPHSVAFRPCSSFGISYL